MINFLVDLILLHVSSDSKKETNKETLILRSKENNNKNALSLMSAASSIYKLNLISKHVYLLLNVEKYHSCSWLVFNNTANAPVLTVIFIQEISNRTMSETKSSKVSFGTIGQNDLGTHK